MIDNSQLESLLEVLMNVRQEKFLYMLTIKKEHPEYFENYRIQEAMVKAMGTEYEEIATVIERWLDQFGEKIIPLLKKDFDPTGEKEMVRRLRIIEKNSRERENNFYRSILQTAEGEIRAIAIYALRHEKENGELLVHLSKTEKGICGERAHWALAYLETSSTWEYFTEAVKKDPDRMAKYMEGSTSIEASVLVGQMFDSKLDILEKYKDKVPVELYEKLQRLFDVLPGKFGDTICNFYRRAAAYGTSFDKFQIEKGSEKKAFSFRYIHKDYYWREALFSEVIPMMLLRTLVFHPCTDLAQVAEELYKKYGMLYAAPAMMAAILTKDAVNAYQSVETIMHPNPVKKKKGKDEYRNTIEAVLGYMVYDTTLNSQAIQMYYFDTANEMNYIVNQPLKESLDMQWYKDLIEKEQDYDDILIKMIHPEEKESSELLIHYFRQKIKEIVDNGKYVIALKQLGWTEYKGMIYDYCDRKSTLDYDKLREYMNIIPISKEDKAKELEKFAKRVENKKASSKGLPLEVIHRMIEDFRSND